jgi:protein TonB
MFEGALLDSSPRRTSVLRRNHYLLSAFAGTLVFAQGMYTLPLVLAPAGERALFIAAALPGPVAALTALMLCFVWADTRQQHLCTWPWLALTLLLNLPGFLIYLVYSAQKSGDWKRAAIPLAYVAESMMVGLLVLVPLIYTQALPRQYLSIDVLPPPPPGPPPVTHAGHTTTPPTHHPTVDPFVQPPIIPPTIAVLHETPEPPQPVAGPPGIYVPGGVPGDGRGTGFLPGGAPWETNTTPPPPPQHTAASPTIVRLSKGVVDAKAIYQPRPEYPHIAIIAHIQGTVVLQAIIGKDGAIQNLTVVSGSPLLNPAALNAVRTWRYQPTLLNNEPVEVLTEIDVIFKLGE